MVVRVLLDENPVNPGALGSHHNENFFGHIKRLSHGDENLEVFMNVSEKAIYLECR